MKIRAARQNENEGEPGAPPKPPPIRRDLRAAVIGGLTATFVVAAAFAPKLVANSNEVRVRNSSTGSEFVESSTTSITEDTTASEQAAPATAPAPSATGPASVARPTKSPTTATTPLGTSVSTQPATTTSTVLLPPSAPTGVAVRPATYYASWNYSDAVQVSWNAPPTITVRWRIRYDDTTIDTPSSGDSLGCCQRLLTGLTPDRDYTFAVTAFNDAGESPAVTVTAHTRADTAPRLTSIIKNGPGSFHVTMPKLHSVFISLAVPDIDKIEHPPIPGCSAYPHNDGQVDCNFTNLAAGHWQVHSIRVVDTTGRSTTYFADGRLQEYGLAAMEATTVAGPYRKTTLDFTPLAFDIT